MQRSHGSCIINRSAGNQEGRQLWRMLQDGNYHQGEPVRRWNKQEKMRKNYVFSCWPSTTRMAWRGSCGWTTSCPSSTKLRLKTIFMEDAVMAQTTNPNVKETCHLHPFIQLVCDKHLWFYIYQANVHGGCEDSIPAFQILFEYLLENLEVAFVWTTK